MLRRNVPEKGRLSFISSFDLQLFRRFSGIIRRFKCWQSATRGRARTGASAPHLAIHLIALIVIAFIAWGQFAF
jgi:hypothetical protein